ncbi:MAG TPA: xanthine dehydrogenase small subunit [Casimicrobiaceae bacterium]|nr:xanthine dehydrogenase small subunit [Casimicrobiaceae bacterium]
MPAASQHGSIRFLLNGEPVAVEGAAPTATLLEYLREACRLTGTKEGCAEGDCGACTIVLAEPAEGVSQLCWKPVNACIRLLPSVAGKAVFTVESLKLPDGSLHPVQRALAEGHGSQCGFCTPGFAMSLFGLFKNAHRPSTSAIEDALSGNLCRCTGYRPIVDAAQAMYDDAHRADGWRACGVAADGSRVASSDEERLCAQVASLAETGTFEYAAQGRRWWAPRTIDALAGILVAHPDARIVAGATDVGLWITKHHRDVGDIVYTGDVARLREIRDDGTHLSVGAAATLTDAFAALDEEWPELHEAWARFASVPIRNSGTLGGNVANGSPIGDSMPALMALGATVVLRRADATREMALEDFYLAYQKTALAPGEFVVAVRVPHRAPNIVLRAYKVSKRYDQDISAVFACFALALDGTRIVSARIGCGGVAAIPSRARATEAVLAGQPWNDATADTAVRALANEFTPIDDMRATAAYRRAALANLLRRFRLETSAARVCTRIDDALADERA